MTTFYVRPKRESGYGTGDGRSYANAWNGVESVDWSVIAVSNPSTLWICGSQVRERTGVLAIFAEWDYSAEKSGDPFTQAIAAIAGANVIRRPIDLPQKIESVT